MSSDKDSQKAAREADQVLGLRDHDEDIAGLPTTPMAIYWWIRDMAPPARLAVRVLERLSEAGARSGRDATFYALRTLLQGAVGRPAGIGDQLSAGLGLAADMIQEWYDGTEQNIPAPSMGEVLGLLRKLRARFSSSYPPVAAGIQIAIDVAEGYRDADKPPPTD